MHDDDKLKLALEAAENSTPFWEFMSRADRLRFVKSALAAINALDPQLVEAVGLLRSCIDGGHSYESEGQLHDAVRAFLAKQGDA